MYGKIKYISEISVNNFRFQIFIKHRQIVLVIRYLSENIFIYVLVHNDVKYIKKGILKGYNNI